MRDHIRILGWLNIVLGGLGLLGAVVLVLFFGGLAGLVRVYAGEDPETLRVAIPVLGLLGTVVPALVAILSLPALAVGIGLIRMRPWARTLGIVLSALHLLNVPVGTAVGIYGLWVLLNQSTAEHFAQAQKPPA